MSDLEAVKLIRYGSKEDLPRQRTLRAGPLALKYENGDLRNIRLGGNEIINRIYCATRDRNWGTVAPVIREEKINDLQDSFSISYVVENIEGDIDYIWKGEIIGASDGSITFSMDGVARSNFLRNRIGFCILHPRESAGARCKVLNDKDELVEGELPRFISPDAPFLNMRSISHEVRDRIWCSLEFEGDVFEMEDQRNWIDASFKTFCTPLSIPYPVTIKEGQQITQKVTLAIEGLEDEHLGSFVPDSESVRISPSESCNELPDIGTEAPDLGSAFNAVELERLKSLNLGHLRVELWLSQIDFSDRFNHAMTCCEALGTSLEIALFVAGDSELSTFSSICAQKSGLVKRILLLPEKGELLPEAYLTKAISQMRELCQEAEIGSGTPHYFTELNRNRPSQPGILDCVCYSLNPQTHAFDNQSLIETLAAHADTIDSARNFLGDVRLVVSPVTLKMHRNPYVTSTDEIVMEGSLPRQVDPRQMSLFGACWTLGSIKYLAEGSVAAATYYKCVGWLGLMESQHGSPLPELFPSVPGSVFPLYHVLADINETRESGAQVVHCQSSDPMRVECMLLKYQEKKRYLIANMTNSAQRVVLENCAKRAQYRILDERSHGVATQSPELWRNQSADDNLDHGRFECELLPYAYLCLDNY